MVTLIVQNEGIEQLSVRAVLATRIHLRRRCLQRWCRFELNFTDRNTNYMREYQIGNDPMPEEVQRPSILKEVRGVKEPLRLLLNYRSLTKRKIGNGHRVIVIPGWKADENAMLPIKSYLNKIGFSAEDWGLGTNNGAIEAYRDELVKRIRQTAQGESISLVGWSLGGVVAREVARKLPKQIASVVTYGTPVIGGPKFTIGGKYWDASETKRLNNLAKALDIINPIQVPLAVIFTKNDSVVSWPACLDYNSLDVKHFEVSSTHLSLGVDPQVWRIVAEHLEQYQQ